MRAYGRRFLFLRVIIPAVSTGVIAYLALTLLVSSAVAQNGAYAFTGCRFDPDSIDPISYRFFSVGADYETAFKNAEKVWDRTTAPGYFSEHSYSFDPEINVTDDSLPYTWGGKLTGHCSIPAGSSFGNYTGDEVEIQFNTRVMDSYTGHNKKLVALHEIGHAYGLDHVYSGCRLMRLRLDEYNSCGVAMPSADDIAGVAAIYP